MAGKDLEGYIKSAVLDFQMGTCLPSSREYPICLRDGQISWVVMRPKWENGRDMIDASSRK